MTYTEKYRPDVLDKIIGQQNHINYLRKWSEEWKNETPNKKAIILHGLPGVGKTTVAHVLANENKWEILELNASNTRTSNVIQRIASSASKSVSFDSTFDKRLIIFDEVDNLHGNSDRGGAKAIINIIKETLNPVILIANDFYKLDTTLKSLCTSLKFSNIDVKTITKLLKDICKKEDITIDNKVLEHIAKNCNGDVRAAVNDLESICVGKDNISIDDVVSNEDKRNINETIFTFVDEVFKGKTNNTKISDIIEMSNNINENPESTIHWFDENIPLIYKDTNELCEAYNLLSKADIFLGRVHKRQNYTMWKYANTLICGIGTIKDDNKSKQRSGFVRYSPPKYWSKLKNSKSDRSIRKTINNKVGKLCHASTRKSSDMLWFIKELMKNSDYSIIISYELGFNQNEIAYLFGCKPNSERVKIVYDIVQELKEDNTELEDIDADVLTVSVKDNVTEDKVESKAQMNLMDF